MAKRFTEAMQAIASQAVEQARIAGLEGETAAMVAAVDAAQRGLLAGLVAVQGTLVAPPAEAAEEHRRGRKTQAERSTGGTISKRPPRCPDPDIRQAMDLVSWSDYRGPGADINYYTDVARHTAKITSKRTGKDVKPYHYKTIANRIRNMSKPRRKPSPQ